jgi:hypothetical protein
MAKKPPKLPAGKIREQAKNATANATASKPGAASQLQLSQVEAKIMSLTNAANGVSSDNDAPFVALKYFRSGFECFSDWEKDELKSFSDFLVDMRQRTWHQILTSSGKGQNKTGMAYTPYDLSAVKGGANVNLIAVRSQIGEDITFFELRLSSKIRVHGFRAKAIFFLVLLDRNHRVFPS